MTPAISLRRAGNTDLEELLPLVRNFYRHFKYPWPEPEKRRAIAELLADSSAGCIWLIVADGALAGYVVLSFYFSLEYDGRTAFLDELWVEHALRGRGIGTAVLQLIADECPKLNVRVLHLEADHDNTRAAALYTRLGYVDHGRHLMTRRI